MLRNAFSKIIEFKGFDITIKQNQTGTVQTVKAAQSNYFRQGTIDEEMVSPGRQYVIAEKNLDYKPKRSDTFIISNYEYYSIERVEELRGFKGEVIGYRITLG